MAEKETFVKLEFILFDDHELFVLTETFVTKHKG